MHKATWVSPDGKTENQINHITIGRKWGSLLDTRVKKDADVASDHHLLLGTVRIKLKKYADTTNRQIDNNSTIFTKLKSREIKHEFNCAVRSRFEALEDITEDSIDIGPHYKKPGKKRAMKSYAKCVAINSNVNADQRKETN